MAHWRAEALSFARWTLGTFTGIYWLNDTAWSWSWVSGQSMQPTLNADASAPRTKQSLVLVRKFRYEPRRGDVVVARSPEKYRDSVIKRIVGVEGDYVVNRRTGRIVRVPDGMCWLEGDNPLMSRDSTDYGPLPYNMIVGKATRVLIPQTISVSRLFEGFMRPLPAIDQPHRRSNHHAYIMQEMDEYKRKAHLEKLLAQEQAREQSISEEIADELARFQHNFVQLRQPSLNSVRESVSAYARSCSALDEGSRAALIDNVLEKLGEACVSQSVLSPASPKERTSSLNYRRDYHATASE